MTLQFDVIFLLGIMLESSLIQFWWPGEGDTSGGSSCDACMAVGAECTWKNVVKVSFPSYHTVTRRYPEMHRRNEVPAQSARYYVALRDSTKEPIILDALKFWKLA
jgi:hypothetical protein